MTVSESRIGDGRDRLGITFRVRRFKQFYTMTSVLLALISVQSCCSLLPQQDSLHPPSTLHFAYCYQSLYAKNITQYTYWKETFQLLHPDWLIYDAGAYCELNDGSQLITYSYLSDDKGRPGQTIALFDRNNKLLKETKGFYCPTLGDLGFPTLDDLKDNKVRLTCRSGDGPVLRITEYELDLGTFNYKLLKEETTTAN